MNGLADRGWDVHYQAHNFPGQTLPPNEHMMGGGIPFKFTLYGAGRAPYAQDLIIPRIRELKPDVTGILLDTFMMYPWYLQQDFAPAKTYFYYPSDGGGGLPVGCENILKKVHMPVAMAKFGQRQAKAVHNIDTAFIPHGVDTKMFYPLSKEKKLELKKQWKLEDKFVVGIVSRNQGRKMLDRAVKAFWRLAQKRPDAILFLHSDPQDGASVFDMYNLINRYKLNNRVVFTGVNFFNTFTYKKMNEIYNLMDVFLLPTSGEGFGVPIIEAMSCGIPVVCTDYTTTRELIIEDGICGEPVNLVGVPTLGDDYYSTQADIAQDNGTITGSWTVERGLMDVNDCASKLDKLYTYPQLIEEYGKVGRKKALKYYNWNTVTDQWDKLLRGLVNG